MSKGKAKSKYDFKLNKCEFENQTWCNLPKHKKCEDCIRNTDGTKACNIKL
jgi:hypothetical protein